jgi:allophanate hydrolase subunit 1
VEDMGEATAVMSLGGDYDASRAVALRTRIARIPGVDLVEFNYTNNKVTVRFNPDQVNPVELKDLVTRDRKHRARSLKKLRGSNEVG